MPKDKNIRCFKLISDVFGSFLLEYKFEIYEESRKMIIARKGDIELLFRLEETYLFYDVSVEIRLSGKTGESATSNPSCRHLGIDAIAKCVNPDHKMFLKKAQTENELREILDVNKEVLLKYCKDILSGDISMWQNIANCLSL